MQMFVADNSQDFIVESVLVESLLLKHLFNEGCFYCGGMFSSIHDGQEKFKMIGFALYFNDRFSFCCFLLSFMVCFFLETRYKKKKKKEQTNKRKKENTLTHAVIIERKPL